MAAERMTDGHSPKASRRRGRSRARLQRAWRPAAELLLRGLSRRLRETADLLVHTGLSYKEIADAMGISPGTVRVHVQQLYRRMGVCSRPRLVQLLRGDEAT